MFRYNVVCLKGVSMEDKKIGFTCSSFDLLHGGHVAMLEECKDHCDYLIVGLNANPIKKGKTPAQGLFERYLQLSAIKYVDRIIPYDGEDELLEILDTLAIDIRFVGSDYVDKDFTGKDRGIETFFNRRDHRFSTSSLKEKIAEKFKKE